MSKSRRKLTPEEDRFWRAMLLRVCSSDEYGQPFLTGVFYRLIPVSAPGLKTMSIDKHWRCYVDFEFANEIGIQEAAKILNHEPWHILREHHARYEAMPYDYNGIVKNPVAFNHAADLTINQDIPDLVPDWGLHIGKAPYENFVKGELTEEYYKKIIDEIKDNTCPQCGQPHQKDNSQKDKNDSSNNKDQNSQGSDENKDGSEQGDSGQGQNGSEQGDSGQGQNGSEQGDSGEGQDGSEQGDSGQGQDGSEQGDSGQGQDGSEQGDSGQGQDGSNAGQGNGQGSGNTCPGCGQDASGKGTGVGNCGSGAGGVPSEYELGDDPKLPGISPDEADIIRKQVAADIVRYYKSNPGKGSNNAQMWAEETLEVPKPDWRTILRASLKTAFAWKNGKMDFNRQRRNRRQVIDSVIMPALQAPIARIAVGVDTSGSNLHNMGVVLGNVEDIARKAGVRGKSLMAFGVDTVADNPTFVNNPKDVLSKLTGGGGTDMRVAFEVFEELGKKKKADIGILLTDLETGWPEQPLSTSNMRYIVCGMMNSKEDNKRGNAWIESAEKALEGWATLVVIYPEDV